MVKGARRHKREEIRRIIAEDERRRKDKAQNKTSGRKVNYRKDKEGNVILFGNLKMSPLSIAVLAGMGAIGVFFYLMSFGIGEMDGYIEPEFSFESCEEGGFTADMCKFYYKFCREYADGSQMCTFAERDPYVDLPDLGDKWTDEEQDFLPPTQFILPFAFADNEPVCYSSACKMAHPDLVNAGSSVDPNVTVQEARRSIEELEVAIDKLERDIRKWEGERDRWDHDLERAEDRYDEGEDEFRDAKTAYRHAFDVKVRDQEDIDMQNKASSSFKQAQIDWKQIQVALTNETRFHEESTERYFDALKELQELEDEMEEAEKVFDSAKAQNRMTQRGNNQFVNIILSDTCLTMIENNFPTDCPTYTELKKTWDNTIPYVSGEWTETEFDIRRDDPKMKNHWKYYQVLPNWKIITVDPDSKLRNMGVNIVIHANSFKYLEKAQSHLKNESINATGHERYVWENIKYDEYCSNIAISPDEALLAEAINNIWNGCNLVVEPVVYDYGTTGNFDFWTSQWATYSTWLSDSLERCLGKC